MERIKCYCRHCRRSSEVVENLDKDTGKTFFFCSICGTFLGLESNGTRLWLQTARITSRYGVD